MKDSGNQPVWQEGAETLEYAPPRTNVRADVCVVGAGIAGLTSAYLLAAAGRSVVVVDDGPVAGGMTGATTGHLVTALDRGYRAIEKVRGEASAKLAAQSHAAAIDRIEEIVRSERIACDFQRLEGFLFAGREDRRGGDLSEEFDAAVRAGADVSMEARADLPFDTGPCIRYPRQAQFHPLRYMNGLARAARRRGTRLFGGFHAERIEAGTPARVTAGERKVTARAVIVATNSPINDRVAIHTKQAPYMTYVVGAVVPRDSVASGLYWDNEDPFHYVRLQPLPDGSDCLIVGGEDHKSGQASDTSERHARLEAWARERFPMITSIAYRWAGQVMETLDGLAFIGRNPGDDNVYVVTGDSGNGLTHGTIAGILLTDLILARENPWSDLYDPSRKVPLAAGTFLKENLNVAAQYGDWVGPGDASSADEIPADSGAVVRRGAAKLAVYRDPGGKCHSFTAVCPHLGCIVQWNGAEKTWDCPCHGSRFDKLGKVVNGPANVDLAPAAEAVELARSS